MRPITHIVMHTAATPGESKDISAAQIRRYHIDSKGWADIGYHFVIRFNGAIEAGREVERVGAGVKGFNATTIHICFSGNGDLTAPAEAQWLNAVKLVSDLLTAHRIDDEFLQNPSRVLGHRECYMQPRVPDTGKSCPGKLVDMSKFRKAVLAKLLDEAHNFDDFED